MPKKRRVGRPCKLGRKINYYKRKKKALEKEKRRLKPRKTFNWNYKIVACRNGKQFKYIGKYKSSEDAYEKIKELLDINVVFPVRVKNSDVVDNMKYEYLILERKKDDNVSFLRNEYGKLVEQITNSDNWNVLDKFQYDVEETFWVYGYDNMSDRKTFQWIYENLLLGKINTPYDIIRIALYKNKIVFMHDDDSIDIVFCKVMEDAIRFYNKIEEFLKKDKVKQIFMVGSFNQIGDKRKKLEEKLIEKTGWNLFKIQLSSTTCHGKK